ncbi:MAG: peptide chain release factor N(5)-glutamine methyltransferase [Planctomycetota bacterium]|nr:MAG: peptide chain release factor N(5)-glutamine methyltransferase [Planctomycetota bacterium]
MERRGRRQARHPARSDDRLGGGPPPHPRHRLGPAQLRQGQTGPSRPAGPDRCRRLPGRRRRFRLRPVVHPARWSGGAGGAEARRQEGRRPARGRGAAPGPAVHPVLRRLPARLHRHADALVFRRRGRGGFPVRGPDPDLPTRDHVGLLGRRLQAVDLPGRDRQARHLFVRGADGGGDPRRDRPDPGPQPRHFRTGRLGLAGRGGAGVLPVRRRPAPDAGRRHLRPHCPGQGGQGRHGHGQGAEGGGTRGAEGGSGRPPEEEELKAVAAAGPGRGGADPLAAATRRLAAAAAAGGCAPRWLAEELWRIAGGGDRADHRRRSEPARPEVLARFQGLVARAAAGEPLAYLEGRCGFYDLEFEVGPEVLVPRPDSECLIDWALERAAPEQPLRLADLGTGSGCLLLTLLHHLPAGRGIGVDRSREALAVARRNRERLGLTARARLLLGDWLEAFADRSLDAIVANPPYVVPGEELGFGVAEHEPPLALFTPPGRPLACYERILAQAPRVLRPGGWLLLEVGAGRAPAVAAAGRAAGLRLVGTRRDLGGVERAVLFERAGPPPQRPTSRSSRPST